MRDASSTTAGNTFIFCPILFYQIEVSTELLLLLKKQRQQQLIPATRKTPETLPGHEQSVQSHGLDDLTCGLMKHLVTVTGETPLTLYHGLQAPGVVGKATEKKKRRLQTTSEAVKTLNNQ